MTLKLSTPSSPQAEEPPQLLTDILMNEQLFEVFHGKSLILQAEVKVEKQLDGSPKSMIVSGQVPVTLSKGFRNGKPTREIRVRGHLRRKRSNELGAANAPDSRNSSDRLGMKPSMDWEAEDKYLADINRQQYGWKTTHKDPPHRPIEQAEFQTSSPFRTYSNLGASRIEKRNNMGTWSAGESGYLDQRPSSDNNLQENPTGIANWSPYFDCGSPMSGRTVRGKCQQFQANWDLREKTPTPRVSSPMGLRKTLTQKSSIKNMRTGDWTPFIDIASSSTSNPTFTKTELLRNKSLDLNISENGEEHGSNPNATHSGAYDSPIQFGPVTTTRQEEQREKPEVGDRRWNPRVNRCLLVDENRNVLDEDKEDDNGRVFDEMGLSVARSESVNALKEGKLRVCCKEDTFSTDSGHDLSVHNLHDDATQTNGRRRIVGHDSSVHNLHDDATQTNGRRRIEGHDSSVHNLHDDTTQTNGRRRIEASHRCTQHKDYSYSVLHYCFSPQMISKISHQVGEKLNHLKEMVMKPKLHPENPSNDSGAKRILSKILPKKFSKSNESLAHDGHDNDHSRLHGRQLYHPASQAFEAQDGKHGAEETCPCVTEHVHSKLSSPKSVQERSVNVKSGSQGTSDHCYTSGSQGNNDFRSKINQEMLDKLVQARGSSIDKSQHIPVSPDNNGVHSKITQQMVDELVQARGSSIDKYNHITSSIIDDHTREKTSDSGKVEEFVHNRSKYDKYALHQDTPKSTFNRETESKLVQARENSIDKYPNTIRNNGVHAHERVSELEKVEKLVNGNSEKPMNAFNHQMESKLVQARDISIDKYPQTTRNNGGHARDTLTDSEKAEKRVLGSSKTPSNLFNRPMKSKLVQARGCAIDKYPNITRNNGGHARERFGDPEKVKKRVKGNSEKPINTFNRKARDTFSDAEKVEKRINGSSGKPINAFNHEMEGELVQATESSTDQLITRSNGDHALQTLCHKAQKLAHSNSCTHDKSAHTKDKPIDKFNQEMESNLLQAIGSSTDSYPRVTWSNGDHTRGKSSDLQKEPKLIQNHCDPHHMFIHTQDKPQHKYNGEVENLLENSIHDGCSSTDKYTHTTWTIGDNAQEKPNSRSDDPQGKAENTFSPTHDQYDTKKLNPITTITISRSRTRFFRYNNGHQYQEKAGAQVVTIEAPKGLFYSSATTE